MERQTFNPCSSVSTVVKQKIVRRVEGLFALAGQLELRLAKARGQAGPEFDTSPFVLCPFEAES